MIPVYNPPKNIPVGAPQVFQLPNSLPGESGRGSLCGPDRPKPFTTSLFFGVYNMNRALSQKQFMFSHWRPVLVNGPEDNPRGGYDVIQVYNYRRGFNCEHMMNGSFSIHGDDTAEMMNSFPLDLVQVAYISTTDGLNEKDSHLVRYDVRKRLNDLKTMWPKPAFIFSANSMAFYSQFVNCITKPANTYWAMNKGNQNPSLGQSIFANFVKFQEITLKAIERFGCTSRNAFELLRQEENETNTEINHEDANTGYIDIDTAHTSVLDWNCIDELLSD